jgi:methylglutaconyl-CoA hydratase
MTVLNITTVEATRVLELNRPDKRNALNEELISALKRGLNDVEVDENIRAVIIRGAGTDFCSGADLAAIQKIATASYEENLDDARSLGELFKQIRRLRVPVIAAVRGRALAGGGGLAMACDVICAVASAVFGYPQVRIGFVPAMVAAIVRRNMSERRAFGMLTAGYELTAGELRDIGVVYQIFDETSFDNELMRLAGRYGKLSRTAVEMTKRLLNEIDGLSFDEAIELGAQTNARARMTADCKKGIARFLGK